ncbi:uncharacterized protein RCC_06291 [Ramularia collo-cygni]|uniref:Mitochondrial outer membrane transport complex Sam37/metaxin N-terminal domain-containing protein n=1 Tax=Ramularia collo-cygni TaxID=112498 RepID=A0A2D3UUY4_9PEZI|nr:uncharacterized protein RCC_06291 [Ramularia collo-cygni]CZT20431.1 uncharacterized protein RCC_06291 [Ramularia collo-cygni]
MQLFILGPAFGLPSIDAECNAAVALLQLRAEGSYTIIPTHDQQEHLPRLVDGRTRISGFNNIVRHLASNSTFDESSELDSASRADSLAITSFLELNAPTLLDISLYVSFENYRHATRPAFTRILPWHSNYIIPPQRRSAARLRTEQLGISSLDVDDVHEDMSNRPAGFEAVGKEPGFEAETQKRASLLLPRKDTLRSLLQRPENASIFKLKALADNFFGPLQDILHGRTWLLDTEGPTAVDCLLYGYLGLMLHPQVPQDWLGSTMRKQYQQLAEYTEKLHAKLNLATDADAVLSKSVVDEVSLPWGGQTVSTFTETAKSIGAGLWDQVPLLARPNSLQLQHARGVSVWEKYLTTALLSTTASMAITLFLAVRSGWMIWPHGEDVQIFGRKRLADFGHLGAALGFGIGPQSSRGR